MQRKMEQAAYDTEKRNCKIISDSSTIYTAFPKRISCYEEWNATKFYKQFDTVKHNNRIWMAQITKEKIIMSYDLYGNVDKTKTVFNIGKEPFQKKGKWWKEHKPNAAEEWSSIQFYNKMEKVMHKNKCWQSAKSYNMGHMPEEGEWWTKFHLHQHGFSRNAQKRFGAVLNNFVSIFESIYALNRDLVKYEYDGRYSHKKPVFLTLTVPEQGDNSDYNIKRKCLKPLLDWLIKCKDVKSYVWKAEAQLRGDIHFHAVVDRFLDEKDIRKKWFLELKKQNLLNKTQTLETSSKIVRLDFISDIRSLRFELSGYFATNPDPDNPDLLIYKHDRNKRVRKITGNQWGCSDSLRYPPMSFMDIDNSVASMIEDGAYLRREIMMKGKDATEKKIGDSYIFRQIFMSNERSDSGKRKPSIKDNTRHRNREITERLNLYHYLHAMAVYCKPDKPAKLTPSDFYKVFRTDWLKIPVPEMFLENDQPCFEKYQRHSGFWWTEKK